MKYAYVENGIVKEANRPLPNVWNNISNFDKFDIQTLISFGWYPYEYRYTTTRPEKWASNGSEFEITSDLVIEHELVREKTVDEIQAETINEWGNVRSRRNIELKESDWTQLEDAPFTAQQKESWKIYRQALRDITNYENPWIIVWPEKPGSIEPLIQAPETSPFGPPPLEETNE